MERKPISQLYEDDKHQHLWYSCVILLILTPVLGWYYSTISTIMLGLLKEVSDHFRGSGFCWYDMLANGLGVLLGLLILFIWKFII